VYSTTYCCELFVLCNEVRKIKPSCSPEKQHLGELIHAALTTYCPDFRGLANQRKT